MKPSRGVPPVQRTAHVAKKVVGKKAPPPTLPLSLPPLKLDPFRTKLALNKLASGEGAAEFEAELDALGDYTAYQFFKVVMRSKHVAGEDRMEAAKQILPYETAKKAPVLEMSGGTPEDFAREIRASSAAIDDCIEKP